MVAGRPDWCLSRQRAWGVGIPVFYCGGCNEPIATRESIAAVREAVARDSSDVWFEKEPADLLPSGFACPHCGSVDVAAFRKETDVLDAVSYTHLTLPTKRIV